MTTEKLRSWIAKRRYENDINSWMYDQELERALRLIEELVRTLSAAEGHVEARVEKLLCETMERAGIDLGPTETQKAGGDFGRGWPKPQRNAIEEQVYQEWLLFKKALPELLGGELLGRWVVFKGGRVRGNFATFDEAYIEALDVYAIDGGFIIAKVEPIKTVRI